MLAVLALLVAAALLVLLLLAQEAVVSGTATFRGLFVLLQTLALRLLVVFCVSQCDTEDDKKKVSFSKSSKQDEFCGPGGILDSFDKLSKSVHVVQALDNAKRKVCSIRAAVCDPRICFELPLHIHNLGNNIADVFLDVPQPYCRLVACGKEEVACDLSDCLISSFMSFIFLA